MTLSPRQAHGYTSDDGDLGSALARLIKEYSDKSGLSIKTIAIRDNRPSQSNRSARDQSARQFGPIDPYVGEGYRFVAEGPDQNARGRFEPSQFRW
jgi:hypothetical protein